MGDCDEPDETGGVHGLGKEQGLFPVVDAVGHEVFDDGRHRQAAAGAVGFESGEDVAIDVEGGGTFVGGVGPGGCGEFSAEHVVYGSWLGAVLRDGEGFFRHVG